MTPLTLKHVVTEILDHVVNEENTEFEHVFSLALSENLRQHIRDEVVSKAQCHGLVGLEKNTNKLRNSYLHFLLLFYLFVDHLLLFFVKVSKSIPCVFLFLVTVFQEVQYLF